MVCTNVMEFIKVTAPMFTAAAACFGAWIGWCGLQRWRIEAVGKRKADLAEQALTAVREAVDLLLWARTRGFFRGEGNSRRGFAGESEAQWEARNLYSIPIERLIQDKGVFARVQSLSYSLAAYFGDQAKRACEAIDESRMTIMRSASTLVEITTIDGELPQHASREFCLNAVGWGAGARPDEIDRKLNQAVQDIESLCRPVLTETPVQRIGLFLLLTRRRIYGRRRPDGAVREVG